MPHDPTPRRLKTILYQCQELHLKTCLYSQVKNQDSRSWQKEAILVVDEVGLLANLYQFGHLALVGGGFDSGSHSLLEPCAWGLPLLVGPRCQNQPEFRWMQSISLPLASPLSSSLKTLNVFSSFQEGKDLFKKLLSVLENTEQRAYIKHTLQRLWKEQTGASSKALNWLYQKLNPL